MIPMAADDHIPDTKNRTWPLAACAKHVTWPEVWPQNEIPKTQQSSHWSCPKLGYHGYHQIPWFWKSLSRLPSLSHKPSHRRMIPASPNFLAKQNYSSSPPPPPSSSSSSSSSSRLGGTIHMQHFGGVKPRFPFFSIPSLDDSCLGGQPNEGMGSKPIIHIRGTSLLYQLRTTHCCPIFSHMIGITKQTSIGRGLAVVSLV